MVRETIGGSFGELFGEDDFHNEEEDIFFGEPTLKIIINQLIEQGDLAPTFFDAYHNLAQYVAEGNENATHIAQRLDRFLRRLETNEDIDEKKGLARAINVYLQTFIPQNKTSKK